MYLFILYMCRITADENEIQFLFQNFLNCIIEHHLKKAVVLTVVIGSKSTFFCYLYKTLLFEIDKENVP